MRWIFEFTEFDPATVAYVWTEQSGDPTAIEVYSNDALWDDQWREVSVPPMMMNPGPLAEALGCDLDTAAKLMRKMRRIAAREPGASKL